ncbi:MAG: hypothetical protein J6K88_04530 [Oscillospiraceae bacterium]|nr:hypothetical protein [Oscillospiraceae bacterium]
MKEKAKNFLTNVIANISEKNEKTRRIIISAIVLFFLSLAVFLQNVFYLNNITVLTEDNVLEFVNTLSDMNSIEIPAPTDRFLTDKFMQESADLSFWTSSIGESKTVDISFSDKRGRYRIMAFFFDNNKTAAETFMYFTLSRSNEKIKQPWLRIIKSKYAEFYQTHDAAGPYTYTWYYDRSFCIILSETKEFGANIKTKLIKTIKE